MKKIALIFITLFFGVSSVVMPWTMLKIINDGTKFPLDNSGLFLMLFLPLVCMFIFGMLMYQAGSNKPKPVDKRSRIQKERDEYEQRVLNFLSELQVYFKENLKFDEGALRDQIYNGVGTEYALAIIHPSDKVREHVFFRTVFDMFCKAYT